MPAKSTSPGQASWPDQWERIRAEAEIPVGEPLCIGLSGGADSVLLLNLAARARPRPALTAVHVDHELRGAESEADAEFCAALCQQLGVRFVRRQAPVTGNGRKSETGAAGIEAEARGLRYVALAEEAQRAGAKIVLVGHHADDRLETLLMRWMRGTEMAGLASLRTKTCLWPGVVPLDAMAEPALSDQAPIHLLRPLLCMRRAEVRELLHAGGASWREDSSNQSTRYSRNRVRNDFLPQIAATCGARGIEGLHAFTRAIEKLEDELALRTTYLKWAPPAGTCATSDAAPATQLGQPAGGAPASRGGVVSRAKLAIQVPFLRRRVLWQLLTEGTGRSPSRTLLDLLVDDIEQGRRTRRSLPGRWTLQLRSEQVQLIAPEPEEDSCASTRQLEFAYEQESSSEETPAKEENNATEVHLPLPGMARLPDGRVIMAEMVEVDGDAEVPQSAAEVELNPDSASLETGELIVRWAQPGDRFHGLGAPGSRPLRRFLADAGVPADERGRVPLVFAGPELIWVAGIRPCESRRVRPGLGRRLRLRLLGAPPEGETRARSSI